MMVLMAFPAGKLIVGILSVTLVVIIIALAYRRLLSHFGKDTLPKEDYCILFSLEEDVAVGVVDFYFTAEKIKEVTIHILDENYNLVKEIWREKATIGGNIVKFDTQSLLNGNYFYALISDNQKTMKKMVIVN